MSNSRDVEIAIRRAPVVVAAALLREARPEALRLPAGVRPIGKPVSKGDGRSVPRA